MIYLLNLILNLNLNLNARAIGSTAAQVTALPDCHRTIVHFSAQ